MLVCLGREREVKEFIITRDFTLDEIKTEVKRLGKDYNPFIIKEDELKNYVPIHLIEAKKDEKGEMLMTRKHVPIKSTDFLNALCDYENGTIECFIWFGGAKSSKSITLNEDYTYTVFNDIDGTHQDLTKEELLNEEFSNIGKAMKQGNLYLY